MVLRSASAALLSLTLLVSPPLLAQQIGRTAPILDVPDDYAEGVGIEAGPFTLLPSAELRAEYDSNIYAKQKDAEDDLIGIIVPRLEARLNRESTQVAVRAEATGRKYLDHTREDSVAALVGASLMQGAGGPDRVTADVSWQRAIEDRGDPEARDVQALGPRKLDLLALETGWRHEGPRVSLAVRGSATKIDYVSDIDNERDLTNYAGRASVELGVGGTSSIVLIGFVTHRDFRLGGAVSDRNRDATTYGGRAGAKFGEGGLLRGEASIGVFQLEPADDTLPSRTGVSAEASLAYLPRRRLAIILNAFRGDVATVRSGAQSRTDTVVQLGVQAEARANFQLEGSVFYRRSQFIGADVAETTTGIRGEAEYRLTPRLSLVGSATYSRRKSNVPSDEFDRLRAAIEMRLRI
ncbi:conserved hypothetical protein [Altererythrobacter sp. B11]|uniref:outer membrane beta-barrel protein n=1 Tax=Altererythrobacter sp. B11 TaxID=2060312 RepID=UPI000DC72D22|nr:outer membrane beta-barrel protein [Altererythrobacter sp. B11]BBC72700.1 conserved hypothetical protein [Altererythrobacter sp. B11]